MTDKKISELTSITGANVSDANDVLPIVDTSVATTKKITRAELFKSVSSVDINGGTIDGVTIGGASAGAATFTSATVNGNIAVTGTVDGRDVATDGTKLDGIEAGADVTDTTNVTAAGALMDSELTNITAVKALDQGVATTDSPSFAGITSTGNVGIGTSSPITALQISGTNATVTLSDTNASGGSYSGLLFRNTDGLSNTYNIASVIGLTTGNGGNGALAFYIASSNSNTERMRITSTGNVGIGTSSPSQKLDVSGNVTISGSLSKGSGSFKIDHPIKPDTHYLIHSFIEGPQADNLYRGKVSLVDGSATVNLDEAGRMTEGTFVALNGNVQCFTTNEDGWTQIRGKVEGNILTIEAKDPACTDEVSWLVIGERHDPHMTDANWTDDQGRVITEPEKANNIQTETE